MDVKSDTDRFWVRSYGRVQGPLGMDELRALVRRGLLARFHEVSRDRERWIAAASLTDLFVAPPLPPWQIPRVQTEPPAPAPPPDSSPDLSNVESVDDGTIMLEVDVEDEWFYATDGREAGPVSKSQLESLAYQGRLSAFDVVWTSGMSRWLEVQEVPWLAAIVARPYMHREPPVVGVAHAGPPEPAQAPRNSANAVASLVLGVLGWTALPVLGGLLAVVFGHLALREIDRAPRGVVAGRGMAYVGLALGYCLLVLLAVGLVVVLLLAVAMR